ncbi:hypothetical protein QC764_0047210 [Podospora pseudoanserina]|uniref:Uncharacterized protein n=1 Tax=Podospora pseudoanserina TaxID=2609844 RepID=A0ABR0IBP5_9PEZI|nr:hypothetical protein QC764_0047210 [Podospora pseudoanserina]
MDWINPDSGFTNHDFTVFSYPYMHVPARDHHTKEAGLDSNSDLFSLGPEPEQRQRAVTIWKSDADEVSLRDQVTRDVGQEQVLKNNSELWTLIEQKVPVTYTLICPRAPEVFPGQPSLITDLPFSEDIWKYVTDKFHVHRNITRTILRNVAYFSAIRHRQEDSGQFKISYTSRTTSSLPDDIALSSTYIPSLGSTFSIIYGSDESQMEAAWQRLQESAPSHAHRHPLLMLGIVAELERERLVNLAEKLADQFTLSSDFLTEDDSSSEGGQGSIKHAKMQEYLGICLMSRNLVDHIRSTKRQLLKVLIELDQLEEYWLSKSYEDVFCQRKSQHKKVEEGAREAAESEGESKALLNEGPELGDNETSSKVLLEQERKSFIRTSNKMRQRVRDILDEYDDKVDECKTMTQNLSLAMQAAWNQTARQDAAVNARIAQLNTTIALETKSESAMMRSIALLTMIFLPLSCVASVFSTTLFNWSPGEGEPVVSKYIWVLAVIAIVLTLAVVCIWYLSTDREKKRERERVKSWEIPLPGEMV